jgi:hypothetical protein
LIGPWPVPVPVAACMPRRSASTRSPPQFWSTRAVTMTVTGGPLAVTVAAAARRGRRGGPGPAAALAEPKHHMVTVTGIMMINLNF